MHGKRHCGIFEKAEMKRPNHSEIAAFLETCIVPLYDGFDAGHQRDHAHAVMRTSHKLAQYYPEVDETMLLVAAAYHDVGLAKGREHHHTDSAIFMRADERLRQRNQSHGRCCRGSSRFEQTCATHHLWTYCGRVRPPNHSRNGDFALYAIHSQPFPRPRRGRRME